MIDLSRVRQADPSAVEILDHARTEAERRRVGIYLIGAGPLMAKAAPHVRHRLGRWRSFPTLDVARAVLIPTGAPTGPGPVDPDAIVILPSQHDRL